MSEHTALIIEDDANLSKIFSASLKAKGFTTEAITDGREASDNLRTRENIPDLIVLDLHLPFIPGTELLDQIRADERMKNVRVMLVTADPRLGEEARQEADLLLLKPVSVPQLQKLAQRLVGG